MDRYKHHPKKGGSSTLLLPPLTLLHLLRVAKFKHPRILGDQKISEDNQELRLGCPSDYQIFCERIDPNIFIPTNLSSYLSLANKKQQYDEDDQIFDFGCPPTTNFRIEFCYHDFYLCPCPSLTGKSPAPQRPGFTLRRFI